MFIAKFNQVSASSSKFKPNKHGQMPFIGTILAGVSTASVIDATIFENALLAEGQLYLCENGTRSYEGREYPTVEVVTTVTALEYVTLRKEIGAGKLHRPTAAPVATVAATEAAPAATAVSADLV